KEEDMKLAEIVLQHIRNGKTQLEAFKQAGEKLSRSSAACGFRWNATIRKHHSEAVELAKSQRKQHNVEETKMENVKEEKTIESVIFLLEKFRDQTSFDKRYNSQHMEKVIERLKKENKFLKQKVNRYEEAWREMGKLWDWIDKGEQKMHEKNEH